MRPDVIRRTILAELRTVAPYALPVQQLLDQVNIRVRPAIKLTELKVQLSWLADQAMVGFLPDDFDPKNADARRWLIKEAGLAALSR
jgi:hypothetical protein